MERRVQSDPEYLYAFSMVVPTFNRAYLLPRALRSIEAQTYRDFEVVIVDDGSTDGTADLVSEWRKTVDFPIQYLKQANQGRHGAMNTGVRNAKGFFIVFLDSDDELTPEALERLLYHWNQIPDDDKAKFAGVEGLCADITTKKISGKRFPKDVFDSNYLETRKNYHIGGEKKRSVRTEIHRLFPFPMIPEEKYMRPSVTWNRIAHHYKFRYINEIIQLIEYQNDGLNANRFQVRLNNPKGLRLYYYEEIVFNQDYNSFSSLMKCYARYIRYSLHSGIGLKHQFSETPRKIMWLINILPGLTGWMRDRIKFSYRKRHASDT